MADCFSCESLLHAEKESTENGDFRSHTGMSEWGKDDYDAKKGKVVYAQRLERDL